MHRNQRAQQFLKKGGYLRNQPASGDREVATHSFSTPPPGGVWKNVPGKREFFHKGCG